MYCEQCQSEYPEDRKFCPRCGVLLKAQAVAVQDPLMQCPGCGNAIEPTRKFCIYCGARLRLEPRSCPACGVLAPAEAAFCGECGTPLAESGTKTLELLEKPRGQEFPATESPTVLFPSPARGKGNAPTFQDHTTGIGNNAEEKGEDEPHWFHLPVVRVALAVALLSLFGFFAYYLSPWQQTPPGQESAPSSRESTAPPSSSSGSTPTPSAAPPSSSAKEKTPGLPDPAGEKHDEAGDESALTEEPLSPPRFYNVVKATAVRDKPSRTGKEVAQLEPETSIYVVAQVGDWLKVESKATPPKPPGYVWKEDAVPE